MTEFEHDNLELFLDVMKFEDGTPIVSAESLDWLIKNDLFIKPAAIKYHGNRSGGLFAHSLAVTNCLLTMTKNLSLEWQLPRSPYIVGMFHDLCKTDDYKEDTEAEINKKDPLEKTWVYNKDKILSGHGDKSVMLLSQFYNLTEEELMCIRFHMGAYETEGWDAYDKAIRKYPNVLWTHTADMQASKILNI
jgi:hypothetical protein